MVNQSSRSVSSYPTHHQQPVFSGGPALPVKIPVHAGGAVGRVSKAIKHSFTPLASHLRKVVVACSGGADSLALALALSDWGSRHHLELYAVCVDHGWRAESAAEAAEITQYLRHYSYQETAVLPLKQKPVGTDKSDNPGDVSLDPVNLGNPNPNCLIPTSLPKKNAEGQARQLRYTALIKYAQEIGALGVDTTIALGHTQDDQAESVLLGLARGSGAGSLQAMSEYTYIDNDECPNTIPVYWRPLLRVPRADTQGFCQQLGVPYVDDPSNYLNSQYLAADGRPLRRAALRHQALPALSAALGVDIRPALARTADRLQADQSALQIWARQLWEQSVLAPQLNSRLFPHSQLTLRLSMLRTAPLAIRTRVWRLALKILPLPQGNLKSAQIEMIDRLVMHKRRRGPIHLPGQVQVWRVPAPSRQLFPFIPVESSSQLDGSTREPGQAEASVEKDYLVFTQADTPKQLNINL